LNTLQLSWLAIERVKFDMQKLVKPEITGIEYQQGTLFNYDVKEYLLEKYDHQCMYCKTENDRPLEIEHIVARSRGGSNRVSNLGIACHDCNQKKSNILIEVFLKDKPELLKKILSTAQKPLRDAAAVNATRNQLYLECINTGLPVNTGSGSQTKYNRHNFNIPKTHALDAACVGNVLVVNNWRRPHLEIKCTGRGQYQRTKPDQYGFPRTISKMSKRVF